MSNSRTRTIELKHRKGRARLKARRRRAAPGSAARPTRVAPTKR
jgi:hypothetical protein